MTAAKEISARRHARLLLVAEHDALGVGGLNTALQAAVVTGAVPSSVQCSLRLRTGNGTERSPFPSQVFGPQLETCLATELDAIGLAATGPETLFGLLADACSQASQPLMVDANLIDRDGRLMVDDPAVDILRRHILSSATLFMANVHDLEVLTGRGADEVGGMKDGARRLHDLGASRVLVTGGRTEGHALDIYFDGEGIIEFGDDRIPVSSRLRGAGSCLLSAIAAARARQIELPQAIQQAKELTSAAIRAAAPSHWGPVVQPMAAAWSAMDMDPTPIVQPLDPGKD